MIDRYVTPDGSHLRNNGPLPLDRPFTTREAGVPPPHLGQLVAHGFVRRVLRGVYVSSHLPDTLALRARALSLIISPSAVVTDRTAAWLHGVDVLLPGEQLEVPPICVHHRSQGGRVRRPEVAAGQRTLADSDVMRIDGVLVTTPLRTACDLAMQRNRDRAFGSLEAMLHAGVAKSDVEGQLVRFKGRRHVRSFRAFLPWAESRADSIPESITKLRWYDTTPPYPQQQRPVIGPRGQEWSLDLGVDDLFFAVEYDGEEFHGPEDEESDAERRQWIERNTPWTIKVVTKANIFGTQQDFDLRLPEWIAEARRTLASRLRRSGWDRWYDAVGD
jgi:hypothetical protein